MGTLFPVLFFFVVIIVIIIAFSFYNSKKEKERTLAMQQIAHQMGWTFAPEANLEMIPHYDYFQLFNQGHAKGIENMLSGQINDMKAAIFEYKYTIGTRKSSSTHRQSVFYFETPKLQLPMFTLVPENFIHKIVGALGYQDIDFTTHPEFSNNYMLRGKDEQAIRNTFTPRILKFYEGNQGLSTEGCGCQLFLYRHSERLDPQEAGQDLQWAASIVPLFQRP